LELEIAERDRRTRPARVEMGHQEGARLAGGAGFGRGARGAVRPELAGRSHVAPEERLGLARVGGVGDALERRGTDLERVICGARLRERLLAPRRIAAEEA